MSSKTAFIGLGVMGYPMAGHIASNGHEVTAYNSTAAKAEKWAGEHGSNWAETPAKAAEGADVVCACVGNDDDLRSVVYGDGGIFSGMKSGAVFVDHTTASADVAAKSTRRRLKWVSVSLMRRFRAARLARKMVC